MIDLRLDMPLKPEELDAYLIELNALRKAVAEINREPKNPAEMANKIVLIVEAQHIIGEIYGQMVYEHSIAYMDRKNAFSENRKHCHGTEKEKDAAADLMTKKEREKEAIAKSNMKRWEMQYDNCEQRANAYKKRLEIMYDDMRNRQGRSGG